MFILLFIMLICVMAGKMALNSDFRLHSFGSVTHHAANKDYGWNLILVNHDNYIPDDYEIELTELSNRIEISYNRKGVTAFAVFLLSLFRQCSIHLNQVL